MTHVAAGISGGSHWPRFINLQKNFRNLFVAGEIIYLIAIIQWPAAAAAVAAAAAAAGVFG